MHSQKAAGESPTTMPRKQESPHADLESCTQWQHHSEHQLDGSNGIRMFSTHETSEAVCAQGASDSDNGACAPRSTTNRFRDAGMTATDSGTGPHYFFRYHGAFWTVGYRASHFYLKNLRGCHYLAYLLRHPHRDVHVLDLSLVGLRGRPSLVGDTEGLGLRIPKLDRIDPVVDRQARRAYRARLHELLSERTEAELDNDLGRLAQLSNEMEFLAAHLTSTTRLTGAPRSAPTPTERARINVKNSINVALHAIANEDTPLFRHLRNSVKTGAFCSYAPDYDLRWEL